ncbi:MAG: hypothetical protein ETSY2_46285 [Candidatus Entotheonella gemina]|uniref:Uncharacterized protein n=1 Tax=Candidatus Entotheonella gemina TaxID=1429439 RepID=W4LEZ3_9BACT|nr:MAG: hypothetical protein ETSY2_46285 [Candidatus Entotheonella gemina]
MLYIGYIGIAGVFYGGIKLLRADRRKKEIQQFLRTKKRLDQANTELLQETFFVTTQYTSDKAKDAIDRELRIALGSLGLSTITSLIYPPLGIISLFGSSIRAAIFIQVPIVLL